jgi:uncharacterized protein
MRGSIMLRSIMKFLDRHDELDRLQRAARQGESALVVVYGRRRIGKTRLLLEWCERNEGLYTVADQSAPEIQRRYFAESVATRLPGFADVEYPNWPRLLARLARDAANAGWRGPVVIDELPYLAATSPELPSALQRWVDHDARQAGLVVALAGSSQRMMQGLVLAADAPLFGRAQELMELAPLPPQFLAEAFDEPSSQVLVELHAAWGGVPRYWELARDAGKGPMEQVDRLVLDPLGPLHREPDRLLLEELPPAIELRPILDAIGAGAHRVSEIGGRIGRPATSMARPIDRLVGMGLVRREVPFAEPERTSRRSRYHIDDPFFRLWFRVVAPHRALLAASPSPARRQLLERYWPSLAAQGWEELGQRQLAGLGKASAVGRLGPWSPASRWWRGNEPEWDVVSRSLDGRRVLLGEAKWSPRPLGTSELGRELRALSERQAPTTLAAKERDETVRVLLVPALAAGVSLPDEASGVLVVTAAELLGR